MRLRRVALTVVALGGSLAVGGCGAHYDNTALIGAESLEAQAQASRRLGESADRAARAQEELARIQTARTRPVPAPVDESLSGVPEELRRPVTLEWSGPAEAAARQVAAVVGWEFTVVGDRPAAPTFVDVSLRERPAVKALEDIGLQAQPFAQVVADPNLRRVEFRYVRPVGARTARASRVELTK